MGIFGWVVVGLIAGGLARRVTNAPRQGCLSTIAVGVIGGVIGGAAFNAAGDEGVTDFSLWSIFVAFIGAVVLLLVLQAVGVLDRDR